MAFVILQNCDLLTQLVTLVPPGQCAAKQPLTKSHHISVTLCETALSLVVNQGDYVNYLTFYQMHPTYLVPKATTG